MYDEAAPGQNSNVKMKALRNALNDKNNALNNIQIMNRAVRPWTTEQLNNMSNSAIINMSKIDEIKEYFEQKGINIIGFDKLNIEDIKAVFAGVDDGLKLMPEAALYIKDISYNPRLKSQGIIDGNEKIIEFGPNSFHNYGAGMHEVSHGYDFAMTSRIDKDFYSEKIVKQACNELNIKLGGPAYKKMAWDLVMDSKEVKRKAEVYAYAVESQYGMNGNKLSAKIVEIMKLGKL